MTSLQELILCHNQIRELPEIGGTELKSLYVSHNRLSQLPFFLYNRAKLEELDLSHNCLDNSNNKKDLFMSNLILILKQLRTLKLDPQYNGTNQ
jgi:Leucine-rich repeat (LRR) protein